MPTTPLLAESDETPKGADEEMFEEMLSSLQTSPRSIPLLPLAVDDETLLDEPDAPPRLVSVPLELLEGFTPMARQRD